MPQTLEGLEATDRYRARALILRAQAVGLLGRGYTRFFDPDDWDASWRRFVVWAELALRAAQREGVNLTEAYLAEFLTAELGRDVPPEQARTDELVGVSRTGRPLAEVLNVPIVAVARGLSDGVGRERALQIGLARLTLTVSAEAYTTPRDTLAQLLEPAAQRGEVIGWRRVTSANACGACLAASTGALERIGNRLRVHPHCRCTMEPVVAADGAERFLRPTGQQIFDGKTVAEQNALFHGRGGAEKAQLLRDGLISLDDLIQPLRLANAPDGITETPLSALSA